MSSIATYESSKAQLQRFANRDYADCFERQVSSQPSSCTIPEGTIGAKIKPYLVTPTQKKRAVAITLVVVAALVGLGGLAMVGTLCCHHSAGLFFGGFLGFFVGAGGAVGGAFWIYALDKKLDLKSRTRREKARQGILLQTLKGISRTYGKKGGGKVIAYDLLGVRRPEGGVVSSERKTLLEGAVVLLRKQSALNTTFDTECKKVRDAYERVARPLRATISEAETTSDFTVPYALGAVTSRNVVGSVLLGTAAMSESIEASRRQERANQAALNLGHVQAILGPLHDEALGNITRAYEASCAPLQTAWAQLFSSGAAAVLA